MEYGAWERTITTGCCGDAAVGGAVRVNVRATVESAKEQYANMSAAKDDTSTSYDSRV